MALKIKVLTSGSSFTLPADWNPIDNSIHVIGGGSDGGWGQWYYAANGGVGGCYARINNFNHPPGTVCAYNIGRVTSGYDTWFYSTSTLLAKGAQTTTANCVGDVKYQGGAAAGSPNGYNGGGGGGAAGPHGAGQNASSNNGGAPDNGFANAASQWVDTISGTAYGPKSGAQGGNYQGWGYNAGYGGGAGGGGSTGASWTTQGGTGGPGLLVLIWNPQKIYTLGATPASFGLTGQTLTPKLTAKLALASGSFAEAGQSAQPTIGRALPGTKGLYALVGRAATPQTARQLPVPKGTLGLTGNPVIAGFQLSAPTAEFHTTGPEATCNVNASLGPAALSLVGNPATFRFDWKLHAEPGDFGITPSEAQPSKGFTLPAAKGIFTRSDSPATAGFGIRNTPGIFHIADSAVGFASPGNWLVILPSGALALSGAEAQLVPGWGASLVTGRLTVSGKPAKLAIGYKCIATPGVFGLAGKPVSFPTFNANLLSGHLALDGGAAKLTKGYQLNASAGFFNMAVNPLRTKRAIHFVE